MTHFSGTGLDDGGDGDSDEVVFRRRRRQQQQHIKVHAPLKHCHSERKHPYFGGAELGATLMSAAASVLTVAVVAVVVAAAAVAAAAAAAATSSEVASASVASASVAAAAGEPESTSEPSGTLANVVNGVNASDTSIMTFPSSSLWQTTVPALGAGAALPAS
jgi:hypothetical protein